MRVSLHCVRDCKNRMVGYCKMLILVGRICKFHYDDDDVFFDNILVVFHILYAYILKQLTGERMDYMQSVELLDHRII